MERIQIWISLWSQAKLGFIIRAIDIKLPLLFLLFTLSHSVNGQSCGGWAYYNEAGQEGDFDEGSLWCSSGYPSGGNLDRSWYLYGDLTRTGDVTSTQSGHLYGSLYVTGDFTHKQASGLTIYAGGYLEIFGSAIFTSKLVVEVGATLIIHGDLDITNSGADLNGNVIVIGNTTLKNVDLGVEGNLILSGDLTVDNGGGGYEGNVYVLDEDAVISVPNNGSLIDTEKIGDQEDLIANESDDSLLDILDDLGIVIEGGNVWIGNQSSDWTNGDNWESGVAPLSGDDITIATAEGQTDPVLNADITVGNLSVESGSLTVSPGVQLTIDGDLDGIDSGLVISSTNENPASVYINGSSVMKVNVEFALQERRYWYIGHCVQGVTMDDYNNSFSGTNDHFLYSYSTQWDDISNNDTYTFDNPMEGYSVIVKDANSVLSYSGQINNNLSYTRDISVYTDNLIANPYPSYIKLSEFSADDFGGASQTIYLRTTMDDGSRGFSTYNCATNYSLEGLTHVAPGQSFWVMAGDITPTTFTINASAREHHTSELKSIAQTEGFIEVVLKNDVSENKTAIFFKDFGVEEITINDSRKKLSTGTIPNIYSLKNNVPIAVSILPSLVDTETVPLGFSLDEEANTNLSLSFLTNGLEEQYDIVLVDNVSNTQTFITEDLSYTFDSYELVDNGRFEIGIVNKDQGVVTDVDRSLDINDEVRIYATDNVANIDIPVSVYSNANKVLVEVYDLSGSKLISNDIIEQFSTFQLPLDNKLWIIKLIIDDESYTQKVMVN